MYLFFFIYVCFNVIVVCLIFLNVGDLVVFVGFILLEKSIFLVYKVYYF